MQKEFYCVMCCTPRLSLLLLQKGKQIRVSSTFGRCTTGSSAATCTTSLAAANASAAAASAPAVAATVAAAFSASVAVNDFGRHSRAFGLQPLPPPRPLLPRSAPRRPLAGALDAVAASLAAKDSAPVVAASEAAAAAMVTPRGCHGPRRHGSRRKPGRRGQRLGRRRHDLGLRGQRRGHHRGHHVGLRKQRFGPAATTGVSAPRTAAAAPSVGSRAARAALAATAAARRPL